jgi:hypothetical protein
MQRGLIIVGDEKGISWINSEGTEGRVIKKIEGVKKGIMAWIQKGQIQIIVNEIG